MKERGKALDTYSLNNYTEFSYSTSDMPCKKHPSSSSGGICAHCLKDKLVNLVCSECGEQRLSSCSCSDVSPYRNSCTGEVGSVGRISFFIENEKSSDHQLQHAKSKKGNKPEEVILLRSSSSCVEIKRSKNGFWKIKRLFRKRKEKGCGKDGVGDDDKSDVWVSDVRGVSRSRSLCSFRGGGGGGGGLNDADEGSDYAFSSAKISDVTGGILFDGDKPYGFNEIEPRKSGFRGLSDAESDPRKSGFRGLSDAESEPRKSGFRGLFDGENEPRKSGFRGLLDGDQIEPRKSGFRGLNAENEPRKSGFRVMLDGENEPRKSGFRGLMDSETGINFKSGKKSGPLELNRVNSVPNRSVFPAKESDFSAMDESAFIDLKLDLSSESKREFSLARVSAASDHDGRLRGELYDYGASLPNVKNKELFSHGGSCRITVNEKELKSGSKGHKIWKWIFRQTPGRRSASKKDENNFIKS